MKKTLIYGIAGIAAVLVVVFIVDSGVRNTPTQQGISSESIPGTPAQSTPSAPQAALNSLGKLPDLSFQDYSGKTVRLADFAGTPLVVNAWAAWCPFCREELKDFSAVQKEFGDQVVVIAIDRGEPLKVAKKYSDELGVTNDLVFLLDHADSFYQAIGGFSMPETIFVDTDGNIRIHKRGPMKADEIREKIKMIL